MVVLKKIRGSTLMETLVATVLIVIIFMIASMTLNSIFYNTIKSRTIEIDAYLNELQYNYQHDKIKLPYRNEYYDWDIYIHKSKHNLSEVIIFEAVHTKLNKNIIKEINEF